jgi:chromosome segregation ATPase
LDNENLIANNSTLHAALRVAINEKEDAMYKLHHAKECDRKSELQIEQLERQVMDLEKKIEKKNQANSTLKSELHISKAEYKESMRFHVSLVKIQLKKDQAHTNEDLIQDIAQKEIKNVIREEESKQIELRRDNALLKLEIEDAKQQIADLTKTVKTTNISYKDLSVHYSKLHEQTKHTVSECERKEHDLNIFRAKATEQQEGFIN